MPIRKFRGRGIAIALLGCAVAGSLGFLFWKRTTPDTPFAELQKARRSQEFFRRQPQIPVADQASVADALAHSATVPDQPGAVTIPDDLAAQLWSTIADWLAARSSGDPSEYAAWAQARGYALTADRADAGRYPAGMPSELENMWRHYSGDRKSTYPPDMKGRAAFDLFYRASMLKAGGLMRPVAVAGGGSSEIVFKSIKASDQSRRPLPLRRWPGVDRWANYQTVGDFVHWMPERSYDDVLARDGRIVVAVVFVGVQGANGDWLPMMLVCYYDPEADMWHLAQAAYSNTVHSPTAVER